jgi:RNA polymerase sigma factor (TIGR02999 family)
MAPDSTTRLDVPGVISDVTRILHAVAGGDRGAADELLPLVYEELRRLAARKLAGEPAGQTLDATALVHEAYLRLVGSNAPGDSRWDGKAHFFAAAAQAMRRILVEAARRKLRLKHGGDRERVVLDDIPAPERAEELLALDDALEKLDAEDPATAQLIHLRFFVGLPIEEAAELLGISRATANRQWAYARAWMKCEMGPKEDRRAE